MSQRSEAESHERDLTAVTLFRQILLWPLFLHKVESGRRKPASASGFLDAITTELEKEQKWRWRDKDHDTAVLHGLKWYGGEGDHSDYSEIVYFHSFVRDFLYGGDGSVAAERPLRVFERTEMDSVCVTVTVTDKLAYRLAVERVELYVFHSAVAIFVLEVKRPKRVGDGSRTIPLAEIIDLQSVLRIAFPRRWNSQGLPSESPLSVELGKAGEAPPEGQDYKPLESQDYKKKEDFVGVVRDRAELPAARHLRFLLEPLGLYGEAKNGYCYQQVEDQRIPSMTYLAVGDPRAITDWDYARLTFFDT